MNSRDATATAVNDFRLSKPQSKKQSTFRELSAYIYASVGVALHKLNGTRADNTSSIV